MMDPGDDVYLEHLLAMTREVTVRVPTSAGLCIDRQDMVGRLNPHADDGVTWFESTSQNLTGDFKQPAAPTQLPCEALATRVRPVLGVGRGVRGVRTRVCVRGRGHVDSSAFLLGAPSALCAPPRRARRAWPMASTQPQASTPKELSMPPPC